MRDLITNPDAWDAIAGNYDAVARRRLTPYSEAAVEWAKLDERDAVLDVACGPGTTTVLAARRAGSVHAVDFAPAMIESLRKNTAELANVEATVGNGQALSFEDARFTAAFSMFGLIFFPDPVAGLRELGRVLRPGGRVFISSWVPIHESPMMIPMIEAIAHAMPPDPDQPPPEPFPFSAPALLAQGLRDAGFEGVEVRELAPEVPIASADEYWDEARGNLFVNHLRETTGEAWPAIEAKVLEHLRTALDGVGSLEMPAMIGSGRKPGA